MCLFARGHTRQLTVTAAGACSLKRRADGLSAVLVGLMANFLSEQETGWEVALLSRPSREESRLFGVSIVHSYEPAGARNPRPEAAFVGTTRPPSLSCEQPG